MLNIFNAVFAEFVVIGNLGQLEPEVTWEGFVSRVQMVERILWLQRPIEN